MAPAHRGLSIFFSESSIVSPLVTNPDAPSLNYAIIDNKGVDVTEEVVDEMQELKDANPELQGQYIPGFYNANMFAARRNV